MENELGGKLHIQMIALEMILRGNPRGYSLLDTGWIRSGANAGNKTLQWMLRALEG